MPVVETSSLLKPHSYILWKLKGVFRDPVPRLKKEYSYLSVSGFSMPVVEISSLLKHHSYILWKLQGVFRDPVPRLKKEHSYLSLSLGPTMPVVETSSLLKHHSYILWKTTGCFSRSSTEVKERVQLPLSVSGPHNAYCRDIFTIKTPQLRSVETTGSFS